MLFFSAHDSICGSRLYREENDSLRDSECRSSLNSSCSSKSPTCIISTFSPDDLSPRLQHTFASFLSRDTTYDLIVNIWRMVHPVVPSSAALPDTLNEASDDEEVDLGSSGSLEENGITSKRSRKRIKAPPGRRLLVGEGETGLLMNGTGRSGVDSPRNGTRPGVKSHVVTIDRCQTWKNLKEVCLDTTFPSAPEKIYNLMYTSGFMKEFWSDTQKLLGGLLMFLPGLKRATECLLSLCAELQISDWAPEKSGSNTLARTISYIKPLNGSIGPRQTKCLLTDENAHVDFDDYVCVITTTRTPDVPSGSAFSVRTRTSLTWSKGNSCRVVVTTGVEWTKSSFIKGEQF